MTENSLIRKFKSKPIVALTLLCIIIASSTGTFTYWFCERQKEFIISKYEAKIEWLKNEYQAKIVILNREIHGIKKAQTGEGINKEKLTDKITEKDALDVHGKVVNSKDEPMSGVSVSIPNVPTEYTDSEGYFNLRISKTMRNSNFPITISKSGFVTQSKSIDIPYLGSKIIIHLEEEKQNGL